MFILFSIPLSGNEYITGVRNIAMLRNMFMNMGMSLNTAPIIDRKKPVPIAKKITGRRVKGNKQMCKEGATLYRSMTIANRTDLINMSRKDVNTGE